MSGQINYVPNIPFSTHNPSTDQPNMLENTNADLAIWSVDHVPFNVPHSGTHTQVTFFTENVPGTQIDPQSTVFTDEGTATTTAELYYANANATLLLSSVKAFGSFTTASTSVMTFNNDYNCASISSVAGVYTVTLNSNVVFGNNILVFIDTSSTSFGATGWTFANPTLTITIGGAPVGVKISFLVIQA